MTFLNSWFRKESTETIKKDWRTVYKKMIVIDDHKKISWSSGWISSFPTICESFSYVNFNKILSSSVYKRPYIVVQKSQFYYEMFSYLSTNILMEETSMLSKRIFTTKLKNHWIRGNNNYLSQWFFIGFIIKLDKRWYFCNSTLMKNKEIGNSSKN